MNNIDFKIVKVFAGTDAQKKVGIHATFTMTIDGPDGVIVQLNDMKLMQTRDGTFYIDSAFRSYDGKDKDTGEEKKIKVSYARLFPDKANWDKKDAIVKLVIDAMGQAPAPTQRSAPAQRSSNNYSRPSPSTSAPQGDPW